MKSTLGFLKFSGTERDSQITESEFINNSADLTSETICYTTQNSTQCPPGLAALASRASLSFLSYEIYSILAYSFMLAMAVLAIHSTNT